MGRDEEVSKARHAADAKLANAIAEDQMGPVLRHGIYSGRCPKCGADSKSMRKEHCPGADDRLVKIGRQSCAVDGEHLHGRCDIQLMGCGFFWREECRDVDDNLKAAKAVDGKSR